MTENELVKKCYDDLESLCKRCGLCCCFYVKVHIGELNKDIEAIMPSFKCKHLKNSISLLNGKTLSYCDIYETRKCLKYPENLQKKCMPDTCGYVSKGYEGRIVMSPEREAEIFKLLPETTQEFLKQGFEYEDEKPIE